MTDNSTRWEFDKYFKSTKKVSADASSRAATATVAICNVKVHSQTSQQILHPNGRMVSKEIKKKKKFVMILSRFIVLSLPTV